MIRFLLRRSISLLLCAGGIVAASQGHASSFQLLEQSASRLGAAFAGTASAADDATTLFFNPAGLTKLESTTVAAVATGVDISSEFRNRSSAPAFGQALGSSGGDAGDWNFVPSAYVATPLANRWSMGLGVNAPFGLKLVYDDAWMGRFQAIKSEIETYNFNPAIAFRASDRVSIGVGANYQRLQAELTSAVNYSGVIAQGIQQLVSLGQIPAQGAPALIAANLGLQGKATVRGDDSAWGYNIGALFDITDTARLGLSYRSAISYTVSGSARFAAPTVTQPVGAQIVAAASAAGGPLSSGPMSVKIKVPDLAIASLTQQVNDRVELLADVAWTGWSSIQELRIERPSGTALSVTPERWDDSWRFSLGGAWRVNPVLKLRGGLAYDRTPVPDSTRTPRLPDPDRKWIAIGAQWRPTESMTLDFGYAHLFSSNVRLDQNAGSTSANGLLAGEQRSHVDIVSAQLNLTF